MGGRGTILPFTGERSRRKKEKKSGDVGIYGRVWDGFQAQAGRGTRAGDVGSAVERSVAGKKARRQTFCRNKLRSGGGRALLPGPAGPGQRFDSDEVHHHHSCACIACTVLTRM